MTGSVALKMAFTASAGLAVASTVPAASRSVAMTSRLGDRTAGLTLKLAEPAPAAKLNTSTSPARSITPWAASVLSPPAELPLSTVALAVVVENAGFGAAAAAPIARRVFDYLLQGQWPSDDDMQATQDGRSVAPMGTRRLADDVALTELGLPAPLGPLPAGEQTTALAASASKAATPNPASPVSAVTARATP